MNDRRSNINGSRSKIKDSRSNINGRSINTIGSRNNANSIGRPLPEYKVNGSLRWMYDRHTLIATVRHVDGFTDDTAQSALRGSFGFFAPEIDSHTVYDLQYAVQLPGVSFMAEGATLALGVKNLTNEDPPKENVDGGFDYFTHDPRGRIVYGRITVSL